MQRTPASVPYVNASGPSRLTGTLDLDDARDDGRALDSPSPAQ